MTIPINANSVPGFMGIYRIVCVPLQRVYIGQAMDLSARWLQHQEGLLTKYHANSRMQAAFNKYGPNAFYFQILEIMHGKYKYDGLTPAEQRWMDRHAKLFNVRPAGSEEWLERHPAARPKFNKGRNKL